MAVVVTGLGATSPLGGDVTSTWEGALAGRSGVRTLDNDWAEKYGMSVNFAGQLAVRPAEVLSRPETKRMDPSAQMAIIATREAWADAGSPEVDPERLGAVVSSGIGGVWTLLSAWDTVKEKGASRVLPLTVPMLMPNSPAAYVELEIGARAGAHAPVSACASGAEAIGMAFEMIESGRADVVVAGGTEAAIHPLPISAFAAMQALSQAQRLPRDRLPSLRHHARRLRARRGIGNRRSRIRGTRPRTRRENLRPRRRPRHDVRRPSHRRP